MADHHNDKGLRLCLGVLTFGLPLAAGAAPEAVLDEISVTATREARATKEVPQAINVIGKERIEDAKMFNIKDVIGGTPGVLIDSKNGGYDARLIIRGAGLKAPYGVREIMVLRDGVPLTDPDSLTRFDWIDTQDIERIEISKGPGNLYSPGSAGGAIQIISKSVFDTRSNVARLGVGEAGSENLHVRYGTMVGADQALAVTASYRGQENGWRLWNKFDSEQAGLKHGVMLGNGATVESEIAYTEANLQLPGSMSAAQFETFKNTGRQTESQDAWKHSGRYSAIWFLNSKYEHEAGDWTFRPRVYFNQWRHYHPVTGMINVSGDWTRTLGTDLEAQWRHRVAGAAATLSFGVTLKEQWNPDVRKYQYRDVRLAGGRIVSTLSDALGSLAETQDQKNTLAGIFIQESLRLGERWLIDAGFRYDRTRFRIDEMAYSYYDYAGGRYVACATPSADPASCGRSLTDKTIRLPAPKLGVSYKLTEAISLYASAAQAYQVPSESELIANPALDPSRTANVEIGIKARSGVWAFDASLYRMRVSDEIVTVRNADGRTDYANAGRTAKKGLEFSGSYRWTPAWETGINYAFSDYRFDSFSEPVRVGAVTVNVSRDGNILPYVPRHQYGLFAVWRGPEGWRVRASANSWGRYYLDNANSEHYEGFRWVAGVNVARELGPHTFALNVENLLDKKYAMQVSKDTAGKVSYTAAQPRTAIATYSYKF